MIGFGVLAAIAFAVVGRGGSDSTPATTEATTTGPPPKPVARIIFPEGFTIDDMAKRIAAVNKIAKDKRHIRSKLSPKRYEKIANSATKPPQGFPYKKRVTSLEGFLFPATYDFTEDTTTQELVHDQLSAFIRAFSQIDLRFAKSKNLTPYDVLIIASMVEKETLSPDERQLVAAVIYNRMRAGMPLGIDATLRYGLNIPPTKSIRESQLASNTPYNTRRFAGLPPTPIANPGLASLQAAAHPAQVNYLYFVRKPDKAHHFFTASERAFLQYECAHGYGCG